MARKKKKAPRELAVVITESEAAEVRRGLKLRKTKLEKERDNMDGLGIPTEHANDMLSVFIGDGKGSGLMSRFELPPDGQGDLLDVQPVGVLSFLNGDLDETESLEHMTTQVEEGLLPAATLGGKIVVDADGNAFEISAFVHLKAKHVGRACKWDSDGPCDVVIEDGRGDLCPEHRVLLYEKEADEAEAETIRTRIPELETYIEETDNETAAELAKATLERYKKRLEELEAADDLPGKDEAEPDIEPTFESMTAHLDLSQAAAIIAKEKLPLEELRRLDGRGTGANGKLKKNDVEAVVEEWRAALS